MRGPQNKDGRGARLNDSNSAQEYPLHLGKESICCVAAAEIATGAA